MGIIRHGQGIFRNRVEFLRVRPKIRTHKMFVGIWVERAAAESLISRFVAHSRTGNSDAGLVNLVARSKTVKFHTNQLAVGRIFCVNDSDERPGIVNEGEARVQQIDDFVAASGQQHEACQRNSQYCGSCYPFHKVSYLKITGRAEKVVAAATPRSRPGALKLLGEAKVMAPT